MNDVTVTDTDRQLLDLLRTSPAAQELLAARAVSQLAERTRLVRVIRQARADLPARLRELEPIADTARRRIAELEATLRTARIERDAAEIACRAAANDHDRAVTLAEAALRATADPSIATLRRALVGARFDLASIIPTTEVTHVETPIEGSGTWVNAERVVTTTVADQLAFIDVVCTAIAQLDALELEALAPPDLDQRLDQVRGEVLTAAARHRVDVQHLREIRAGGAA